MKFIILITISILSTISVFSQGLRNFYYMEDGETYYVLPQENASTLEMYARKGKIADSLLLNFDNKLRLMESRNKFLTNKLYEIHNLNHNSLQINKQITLEYNNMHEQLISCKSKVNKYKSQRDKAWANLTVTWTGIAALIIVILTLR